MQNDSRKSRTYAEALADPTSNLHRIHAEAAALTEALDEAAPIGSLEREALYVASLQGHDAYMAAVAQILGGQS
jgi:hypothetical protein